MPDSRISSTSPGQYDMILAVSQSSINDAIADMWDVQGADLANVAYNHKRYGGFSGKLAGADAQVLADGTGRGSVLFRMTFESGTATLYDDNDQEQNPDMTDWKIAFKVDIALNDVHAEIFRLQTKLNDSDVKPEVKKSLQEQLAAQQAILVRFGKQANDYSIQRLFLNFATADLSSLPKSELSLPGIQDDAQMVNAFGYLLTSWLANSKSAHQTTLGYGLSMSEEKKKALKVADCLIPTSVEMQTYPWKETPGAQPVLGWTGDASYNCVAYCNMTESRPVPGERTLQWSGNFTTKDADKAKRIDGSVCIKRELFLIKFILPLLKQYNDDMQLVALQMDISRDGFAGQRRYHWRYSTALGNHPSYPQYTLPYYDFQQNEMGAQLNNIVSRQRINDAKGNGYDAVDRTEGISWSWAQSCDTGPQQWNDDWHSPIEWTDHLNGRNSSYSAVDVIPVPATGTIKIRGYTETSVKFGGYYTRLWPDNDLNYNGDIGVYAFWQVDIVIKNDDVRGMQCVFQNQKVIKFSTKEERSVPPGESTSASFVSTIEQNLDKMLQDKNAIAQAINDALDSTGKFQHPACGEFNIYNPVFNYRGDILASARYKAPSKENRLNKFSMPVIGDEPKQRDPNVITGVTAVGDVTAPMGKTKGS